MSMPRRARLLTFSLAGLLVGAPGNDCLAADTVAIPLGDNPALVGIWYPASSLPAPAVVVMHGCGGAYDKHGRVGARQEAMAGWLNQHGYSALVLDSFTSRGVKEICTVHNSQRTLRPADRAGDAYAALGWLSARSDVKAGEVSLLGWSHGGSSTLASVGRQLAPGAPRFHAAIAFYPGCKVYARKPYQPNAPLLILIGESDDWTPIQTCRELAAQTRPAQPVLQLHSYPDTWHDFDNPALKGKRHRADVPNGANPGSGVTTAPNPDAARDAWQRAVDWLGR